MNRMSDRKQSQNSRIKNTKMDALRMNTAENTFAQSVYTCSFERGIGIVGKSPQDKVPRGSYLVGNLSGGRCSCQI